MHISDARPEDVESAVACLAEAFAADPLMAYFFPGDADRRGRSCVAFFSLLLRVRMALRMPVRIAHRDRALLGLAMGYDMTRPDWPAPFAGEWDALVQRNPGISTRFDAYDRISEAGRPSAPHFYLGVIGVAPAAQGLGIGSRLLRAFCAASESEPQSAGVYLETATPSNVPFYERHGFVLRAEGEIGTSHLWCLYHAHAR